jgi:hypothetical protein
MASPMPTIGLKSAFERGGGYNSTYSLAGHCMSLLLLRAYQPTFVAEYNVWEESRSEHEMGMNYACG